MKFSCHFLMVFALCVVCWEAQVTAQDWPQWRGPNREARLVSFETPKTWPSELSKKWSVTIGDGVSTPALVGDKLFVFSRQGDDEVLRCLNANTGDELWKDQYAADPVSGPASGFSGPRASPTVADGKVVTLGVHGVLSCFDAETGKTIWRLTDTVGETPRFQTSSSPLVLKGMCIVQLGAEQDGFIAAYDMENGEQLWKWSGDGPSYGSPELMTFDDLQVVIAPTSSKLVALNAADGSLMWEMEYRQGRYNAATPIVDGQTLIVAGPTRGFTAMKMSREGDQLKAEELWKNADNTVLYNTPVLDSGKLYGITTANAMFCMDAQTGETEWSTARASEETDRQDEAQGRSDRGGDRGDRRGAGRGERGDRGGRGIGRQGGGRGGRRGGGGGYGSVVAAGDILFSLTPSEGNLIVSQANADEFKQLASYKVAEAGSYAYPIITANGIFIKDQDAITRWSLGGE